MVKSQFLKSIVLSILAGVVCLSGQVHGAEAPDELLSLIPSESLFAVRVNNFDTTLNQMDTYLAGVSPVPMGLSMMTRMQLAGVLGSPELKGVNTAGSFAAYAMVKPGQMEPVIKLLIPVANYGEFVSGNPNIGAADANGISKVTMNGRTMAVVKKAGGYAMLGETDEFGSLGADKGLGSAIDAAEKSLAVKQPVWAYANVQKVKQAYGPMAIAQMEKSKTMMGDMKGQTETRLADFEKQRAEMAAMLAKLEEQRAALAAGTDVNDPNQKATLESFDSTLASIKGTIAQHDELIASTKETIKQLEANKMSDNLGDVMDVYIRMVQTLLNETASFSVAVEPKADVLNIVETYTAMAGSESAKVLVADTSGPGAKKLVNYLQDGAMVNFSCRLNKPLLRKYYSDSVCLMNVMSGGKMSDEEVAKMKALTVEIIDSLGGVGG